MLKNLFRKWTTQDPMQSAMGDVDKMLVLAQTMIESAVQELTADVPLTFDIYAEDRKLNEIQQGIRRKLIRHLAVNPSEDIVAGVTLVNVIIFVERLGDYAKNIHELKGALTVPFADVCCSERLVDLGQRVIEILDAARTALSADNDKAASEVLDMHAAISKQAQEIIQFLVAQQKTTENHTALVVLYARYLKRVSAHLMNASSAVVNAFDMIGYYPGKNSTGAKS